MTDLHIKCFSLYFNEGCLFTRHSLQIHSLFSTICSLLLVHNLLVGLFVVNLLRYKASEIIIMDRVQEYMDGPRLLRMRLGELVPHSLG